MVSKIIKDSDIRWDIFRRNQFTKYQSLNENKHSKNHSGTIRQFVFSDRYEIQI